MATKSSVTSRTLDKYDIEKLEHDIPAMVAVLRNNILTRYEAQFDQSKQYSWVPLPADYRDCAYSDSTRYIFYKLVNAFELEMKKHNATFVRVHLPYVLIVSFDPNYTRADILKFQYVEDPKRCWMVKVKHYLHPSFL